MWYYHVYYHRHLLSAILKPYLDTVGPADAVLRQSPITAKPLLVLLHFYGKYPNCCKKSFLSLDTSEAYWGANQIK